MTKKVKYLILFLALLFVSLEVYSQVSQGPPTPQMQSQQQVGKGPPCDPGPTGDKPGHGSPPPPPPGLCLPINDYLVPLFISGMLLGAYRLWKIEKNAKTNVL